MLHVEKLSKQKFAQSWKRFGTFIEDKLNEKNKIKMKIHVNHSLSRPKDHHARTAKENMCFIINSVNVSDDKNHRKKSIKEM